MTHEEAFAELACVAIGASPVAVAERARTHVNTCNACSAELQKFEETAKQLSALVPDHPINPGRAAGIRSRLISRASADTDRRVLPAASTAASRVKPPSSKTTTAPSPKVHEAAHEKSSRSGPGMHSGVFALVAGIALIAAAGAIIQLMRVKSEVDSLRATIALQQDTLPEVQAAATTPQGDQNNIVEDVTGVDVKVIALTHYGARGPIAKMFWNRASNAWTLVIYSIRQPKPGKVFQVWLSTAAGTLSAGTFSPDASGRSLVQSTTLVGRNALYSISVTEEARGGAPAPTGPAVIAGAP